MSLVSLVLQMFGHKLDDGARGIKMRDPSVITMNPEGDMNVRIKCHGNPWGLG